MVSGLFNSSEPYLALFKLKLGLAVGTVTCLQGSGWGHPRSFDDPTSSHRLVDVHQSLE
jgi:hypothetical protein